MSPTRPRSASADSPVRAAIQAERGALLRASWLSLVIGVLLLIPSWYMFEVYGRVLNSRNTATLAWLVLMVMGVYVMAELLDLVRSRVLSDGAASFEQRLRQRVLEAAFQAGLRRQPGGTLQPFNDLRTLRDFGSSTVVTSFMDIPTAVLCMLLLFAMGPWLGAVAVVGALVQVWLIWLTERRTMPLLTQAIGAQIQAQQFANGALRNAQVIESMGMLERVHQRWQQRQRRFLARQAQASDYGGITSAAAKLLQSMQGSVLLGAGAWIALHGGLWGGVGMVIIASIFGGRALQPLAQLVQNWRAVIQARDALARLDQLLVSTPQAEAGMPLPPPKGQLSVEGVIAGAPGSATPIVRNITFGAAPGQLLLIIGPTAAGKSTLARLLVGVWPCTAGKVRLDGADVHAWSKHELGPHIGYLPQQIELFDGTVADNIARFGDIDMPSVREAAALVGIDEAIDALPEGYDTRIGEDGAVLSGGIRQRLGLARALYQRPRLIVLDEPNANLDEDGERALSAAVVAMKQWGAAVVAITHRNGLMPLADRILILKDGQVAAFGPRDEVLAALARANEQARAQAAQSAGALQRTLPVQAREPSTQPKAAS